MSYREQVENKISEIDNLNRKVREENLIAINIIYDKLNSNLERDKIPAGIGYIKAKIGISPVYEKEVVYLYYPVRCCWFSVKNEYFTNISFWGGKYSTSNASHLTIEELEHQLFDKEIPNHLIWKRRQNVI